MSVIQSPNRFDLARQQFTPSNLKYIFIAESPLKWDNFFYNIHQTGNSLFFNTIIRACGKKFNFSISGSVDDILKQFMAAGCILVDILSLPLPPNLLPKQIETTLVHELSKFKTTLDGYGRRHLDNHTPIFLLSGRVQKVISSILVEWGYDRVFCLPLPVRGQQNKFRAEFESLDLEIFNCPLLFPEKYRKVLLDSDKTLTQLMLIWIFKSLAEDPDMGFTDRLIYLWIAFNAWLYGRVPLNIDQPQDSLLIKCIASDSEFYQAFGLLKQNNNYRQEIEKFRSYWPIFDSRKMGEWFQGNREDYITNSLGVDSNPKYHKPSCFLHHLKAGNRPTLDWAHSIVVIYQIRCNLFHGGKNPQNNLEEELVRSAFNILASVWFKLLHLDGGHLTTEILNRFAQISGISVL